LSPAHRVPQHAAFPSTPVEAVFSFLKDTKGALTWSARDFASTLNVRKEEAEHALAYLEAQGYVQPVHQKRSGLWMTTPAGESVSGAKMPRFTGESVEQALTALQDRINRNNRDPQSLYRVSIAVAFGDFLQADRPRVQAADVGIQVAPREKAEPESRRGHKTRGMGIRAEAGTTMRARSASEAQAERKFLSDLRAKSAHLNLQPYADWMRARSHRSLLPR
jgi:DNA-binding transcriptional MocR family regulator